MSKPLPCRCDYDLAQGCERNLTGAGHCDSEPLTIPLAPTPGNEFFHGADHNIWSYCIYLGPYTDEHGMNVDLGVYVERPGRVSLAAVYGPEISEYKSGEFIWNGEPLPWISERPIYKEALRRYREHLAKKGGEDD